MILFESLSGSLPFTGENPSAVIAAITADEPLSLSELCPDLPAGLCDVVNRALAKVPAQRYQTVDELALALVAFAAPGTQWETGAARKRLITTPGVAPPPATAGISSGAVTMASAAGRAVSEATASKSADGRVVVGNAFATNAVESSTLQSGPTERPPEDQSVRGASIQSELALRGISNSAAESKITAGAWSTEGPGVRPKRTLLIAAAATVLLIAGGIALLKGGSAANEGSAVAPAAQPVPVERTVFSAAPASPVPAAVSAQAAVSAVGAEGEVTKAEALATAAPDPVSPPLEAAPRASPKEASKPVPKARSTVVPRPNPVKATSKPEQNPMHL